ncbi:MAG: hypothetical protein HYV45_02785 [Candidatus Moranbacteria bacterium]|nr:hypothetical protein [Candidatus Moranbacteria bacterium]
MYWVYLSLFLIAVFIPEVVNRDVLFLGEEDVEAFLILCFGMLGFMTYLAKEKALLSSFRERLRLQKRANTITRDLSDSYSYIGEINRKLDIIKELAFRLPKDTLEGFKREEKRGAGMYRPVIVAARLLARTETVSLRFVNLKERKLEKVVEDDRRRNFSFFGANTLLHSNKLSAEENGCAMIRSPHDAGGIVAFVVFPKKVNHIEDVEIFKVLASQALFLYCVEEERKKLLLVVE